MIPVLAEAARNTSSVAEDRLNGDRLMSRKWMQKTACFLTVFACALLAAFVPVKAETARDDADIRRIMEQAIANGDSQVSITVERTFSVDEYQAKKEAEEYGDELGMLLGEAALQNGKLMSGTSYIWQILDNKTVTYKFDIPSELKKVTVLTSERSAYSHAVNALKKRDYETVFYAEDGMYFDTFNLALMHHPEYNYYTQLRRETDGTFGFRSGGGLSVSQIKSKMTQTNTKVNAVIKKIIKKGMTNKQKLQAIHDYLVKNCAYDKYASAGRYDDAFTAYGCLLKKKAVCQGYAAAFNLLAAKAGIRSIAVCGEAGGDSHAWNYVKNGSSYRYIDVTWDDPLPDGGSKAKVSRKYFYLTQKGLEWTHTWDKTEHAKKYVTW